MLFEDRFEAGRQLASELGEFANRNDVVVLALPRGGVPVGYEVAMAPRSSRRVRRKKTGSSGTRGTCDGSSGAGRNNSSQSRSCGRSRYCARNDQRSSSREKDMNWKDGNASTVTAGQRSRIRGGQSFSSMMVWLRDH